MLNIAELAEKYENYIIEMRRYFHQHPEFQSGIRSAYRQRG